MAENNDLKVIVGLDIPKSVVEIEGDLKIIEKALAKSDEGKLKITAGLNIGKTIGIINKQLSELKIDGSRLKIIPTLDISVGNQMAQQVNDQVNSAFSQIDFKHIAREIRDLLNIKKDSGIKEITKDIQTMYESFNVDPDKYKEAFNNILNWYQARSDEFILTEEDKVKQLNDLLSQLYNTPDRLITLPKIATYTKDNPLIVTTRTLEEMKTILGNMEEVKRLFGEVQVDDVNGKLIGSFGEDWEPKEAADALRVYIEYLQKIQELRGRNRLTLDEYRSKDDNEIWINQIEEAILKQYKFIDIGNRVAQTNEQVAQSQRDIADAQKETQNTSGDQLSLNNQKTAENLEKTKELNDELIQGEKELISLNEEKSRIQERLTQNQKDFAMAIEFDDNYDELKSAIAKDEDSLKKIEQEIINKTSANKVIKDQIEELSNQLREESQKINQSAQNMGSVGGAGVGTSSEYLSNDISQIKENIHQTQQELTSLFKSNKTFDISNIEELETSLRALGASDKYIEDTIKRLKNLDFTVSKLSYTLNQSERDGTAVLGALSAKGFDGIGRTISYLEKFDEKTGEFKKAATHVTHSFEDIRKEEERLIKETASADKALEKFTKLTGNVDVLSKKYSGEGVPENISNQIDELKSIIEKYKDLFNKDEYKTKPLHDQQQAIIEINNAINSLIVDVNKYEDNIKDSSQQTLSYIDKQKEKAADFRRDIKDLYKAVTDVNGTKPLINWKLDDESELSQKYKEAEDAIEAYALASKKGMSAAKIHAQDVIKELKRLVKEEQNAEYAASILRAKDFNTVKTSTESDVKKFIEQVKNALGSTEPLKTEIDALNESIAALGDSDKSNRVQRLTTVLNNLSNAQSKFEEINELNKSINSLGKSAQSAIDIIDRFNRSAQFRNNNLDDRVIEATKDLADFREEYVKILNELAKNPNAEGLEKIRNNLLELNNRFKDAKDSAQKLKDTLANQTAEMNTERRFKTLIAQVKEYMAQNTKAAQKYKAQFEGILSQEGIRQTSTSVNELTMQFKALRSEIKLNGDEGKSLIERIKDAAARFGSWMSITTVISTAVRDLRKMVQNVIELDTVMTNLRKVTDETEASYSRFLKNAIKQSQELHTTVSDLVEQVAVWSKLGYSLNQAQDLANVSMIYSKVGEVDNETSVKDLVTIMKAFNIEADDSITIVNRLNKLGNEFATDAASLGQALKVSSAALAESNTSLSETIALITGGVEITQDAGAMGNALRTISMRIRGMKGKLEELGEEFEDVLPVSKLQTQLLNRTKVNILDDENNFRSIYDILKDIAEIYDELDDPTRADVTELLFGKMRANQGIAIIEAFQSGQIQKAFEAAENSAGSAQAEFERWSQSIEASIETFQSAWQGLSETLISSDLVKGIVDFGTTFLNTLTDIIDNVGILIPLLTALGTAMSFKNAGERNTPAYAQSQLVCA